MKKILVTICLSAFLITSSTKNANAILAAAWHKTEMAPFAALSGGLLLLGGPVAGAYFLSSLVKDCKRDGKPTQECKKDIAIMSAATLFAPLFGIFFLENDGQTTLADLSSEKLSTINSKLPIEKQISNNEAEGFNIYKDVVIELTQDINSKTKDMSFEDAKHYAENLKENTKAQINDENFNNALIVVDKLSAISE